MLFGSPVAGAGVGIDNIWEDASAGLVPNTEHRLRRGEKGQFDEG
jgi:hypothetical protein